MTVEDRMPHWDHSGGLWAALYQIGIGRHKSLTVLQVEASSSQISTFVLPPHCCQHDVFFQSCWHRDKCDWKLGGLVRFTAVAFKSQERIHIIIIMIASGRPKPPGVLPVSTDIVLLPYYFCILFSSKLARENSLIVEGGWWQHWAMRLLLWSFTPKTSFMKSKPLGVLPVVASSPSQCCPITPLCPQPEFFQVCWEMYHSGGQFTTTETAFEKQGRICVVPVITSSPSQCCLPLCWFPLFHQTCWERQRLVTVKSRWRQWNYCGDFRDPR